MSRRPKVTPAYTRILCERIERRIKESYRNEEAVRMLKELGVSVLSDLFPACPGWTSKYYVLFMNIGEL